MKNLLLILLFVGVTASAADVNLTNITRSAAIPNDATVLGTTGRVARLLPMDLLAQYLGTNSSGSVTVATLPASPTVGTRVWTTDVVTSRGTGDYCYYDGATWRTTEHVAATADVRQFMHNSLAAGLSVITPITFCQVVDSGLDPGGFQGWAEISGNGGTVYGSTISGRTTALIGTGTSANGYAVASIGQLDPVSTDCLQFNVSFQVSALCDDTEKFWLLVGRSSSASAYPTDGSFFLYDMYNANAEGMAGAETNRWQCITRLSSTTTRADSGVAVAANSQTRLTVFQSSTNAVFYVNGTAVVTNAANIPLGQGFNWIGIFKTAGTTARNIQADTASLHIRHASARQF